MIFNFKNIYNEDIDLFKSKMFISARRKILRYPMGSTELALNAYLLEKYNFNLKIICLKLLNNIKFTIDSSNNIVAIFYNKNYDKIASLITYGNEEIDGSNILKIALSN